jgi:hypothetical protein
LRTQRTTRGGSSSGDLDHQTIFDDPDLFNLYPFWQGKQGSLFHHNLADDVRKPSFSGFSWKKLYHSVSIRSRYKAGGHYAPEVAMSHKIFIFTLMPYKTDSQVDSHRMLLIATQGDKPAHAFLG